MFRKTLIVLSLSLGALLVGCGHEDVPVADAPGTVHTPPKGSYAAKAMEHFQQAHGGDHPGPATGSAK